MSKTLLTQKALEKVQAELDELIKKRKEISEEIKVAREFGDLSENAEYHAAREAQSNNETEILRVKEILENYELVSDNQDHNTVNINSKLTIKYLEDNEEDDITIVTKVESDPFEGMISNESPIGAGLMGKGEGDVVEIITPDGPINIEIVKVH